MIHMKAIHDNKTALVHDAMLVLFVCGTIGIALKFVTFFDQWVYFPSFPNVVDSTFLISAVVYLAWRARKRN